MRIYLAGAWIGLILAILILGRFEEKHRNPKSDRLFVAAASIAWFVLWPVVFVLAVQYIARALRER